MTGTVLRTRRERRARRGRRFVTDREARWAARLARLDYKTTGESGALTLPARSKLQNRSNGRAGSTYVIGVGDLSFAKPIIHHRWRRLIAGD